MLAGLFSEWAYRNDATAAQAALQLRAAETLPSSFGPAAIC